MTREDRKRFILSEIRREHAAGGDAAVGGEGYRREAFYMTVSKSQLHTLRHMLGINTPNDRVPKPYRNYAAVPPGDQEFADLAQLGLVEKYKTAGAGATYDYFRCTYLGERLAIASHRDIRASKGKRMWAKYLDISDVLPGLTFRQFLTSREFRDTRSAV